MMVEDSFFCRAYHSYLLQFDGEGRWTFEVLSAEKRLTLKGETERFEAQLTGIPTTQQQLNGLGQLLEEEARTTTTDNQDFEENNND
jgi:hypothetical protein